MMKCTVKLEFEAAKRLIGFPGNCAHLHGYRHAVEASFAAETMDNIGLSIDFYALKAALKKWLDENWDHNVLLSSEDKELGQAIAKITGQKIFYFAGNPTAENMAQYLFDKVCPNLIKGAKCLNLRLYDNPEAWIEVG